MRKELKILSVLALSLTGQLAFAQIKGKVQESDGFPSMGSKVEIKGTDTFTRTNDDGEFELSTAKVGDVLVITNLDDQKQEVKASDNLVFKFSPPSAAKKETEIEDVIVTGYQVKSSDQISSSITHVGSDQISRFAPSTSTANILQGKGTGLNITAGTGRPGDGAVITVRQVGNLSGNTPPMYVIDGAVSTQEVFNTLNSSDIEEISVLKDAASAAIYGSGSANGVVIVTTKSGKAGKTKFSFNARHGFGEKGPDKNFTSMNAEQKMNYESGLASLGSGVAPGVHVWTDNEKQEVLNKYAHNWQDDILRKSSISSYLFDASGGNNLARYYFSLGYDQDNGIVQYLDGFKKYSGRIKVDMNPSDKLKLGVNIGLNYTKSDDIRTVYNTQNPFASMYIYNPYEPVYNEDGSINETSQGFPVIEALQRNKSYSKNLYLTGSMYGEYAFLDFLKFKTQFSGNYNNDRWTSLVEKGSILDKILGLNGSISEFNKNRFAYTWTNSLNFVKSFGNHNIDFLGLVEYTEKKLDYLRASGSNFSSPTLHTLNNAAKPVNVKGYQRIDSRTFSYGGFLTYDYLRKYIFTASIRQDADSRFGKDNTFSDPIWSVSAAWNIAKEDFMSGQSFINDLKLRASYGLRGYAEALELNANKVLLPSGSYGDYGTLYPSYTYGNSNLKWEITKTQNYGIEYSLWNRRIRGSVDYYIDNKNDFVLKVDNLSTEAGGYKGFLNGGKLRNEGLELGLSVDILKGEDYGWTVYGNISFVKSKVKSLYDGLNQLIAYQDDDLMVSNILLVGQKPNLFYLVRSAGVNSETGEALYYDKKGNITNIYNPDDAVPIYGKSPTPSSYGGFGTTVNFRGFDITADFSFSVGKYSLNSAAQQGYDWLDTSNSNKWVGAENYWKEPGQINVLPRPDSKGLRGTDRFLQNASYLRFRSLEIGYTFDNKILGDDLGINRMRVYFQAQNLYTWTDFQGDPEVGYGDEESQKSTTGAGFLPGQYYLYGYPAVKTFLFGIKVDF